MSSSFRDLIRLVDGVMVIVREAAGRSPTVEAARAGDLEALISTTLWKAIVFTTDVAGISKGRSRHLSVPKIKESIVVFSDAQDSPDTLPHSVQQASGNNPEVAELYKVPKSKSLVRDLEESNDPRGEPIEKVNNLHSTVISNPEHQALNSDLLMKQKDSAATSREGFLNGANSTSLKRRQPRERRVPSTPLSRAIGFAGLGAGLAWGAMQESAKRIVFGVPETDNKQAALSPLLSEQNAERLAVALCRMRGAALKLGQMLSIQDESLVPAPILAALDIVRQGADVMPRSQLNDVLNAELGTDWARKLRSFNYEPLAAASIGQVHHAVMKNGVDVAMKIQYPGVAESIESDIENVRRLLDYTNLIPKGLFLDRAMKVAKEELSRECNYILEASSQKRFRALLDGVDGFYVPLVIDELSCAKVLTTELVAGVSIDKVALLNQETRNYVGKKLLELTLKELFVFRFMQTDPNWGNFLYDDGRNMINLIDFGAARKYPKGFVDDYLRMVMACANGDREMVVDMSQCLGFLTGEESDVMLDSHVQAAFIVGLPFSTSGVYDFRSSNITRSISSLGATMLKHRLTPPPDEAYSLHRKLSGAFLACIKLGAVVPCRELLLEVYEQYKFNGSFCNAETEATSSASASTS